MMYGNRPTSLGIHTVDSPEMMFYQYLPVKLSGETNLVREDRLHVFDSLLGTICCDFIGVFGLDRFVESYVYVTVKSMVVAPSSPANRPGYHSDGFMSEDINYIWSDCLPTLFNESTFNLTMDDEVSLKEMEEQALPENEFSYPVGTLLRLDQSIIHRVQIVDRLVMRRFLKVSFSTDRYNLIGNSHNYKLDYNWSMLARSMDRNIPTGKFIKEK